MSSSPLPQPDATRAALNADGVRVARASRRRNGTANGVEPSIATIAPQPAISAPPPHATMDDPIEILLVDDSPDKLLALEAALSDLGQNVVKASSGREASRRTRRMARRREMWFDRPAKAGSRRLPDVR